MCSTLNTHDDTHHGDNTDAFFNMRAFTDASSPIGPDELDTMLGQDSPHAEAEGEEAQDYLVLPTTDTTGDDAPATGCDEATGTAAVGADTGTRSLQPPQPEQPEQPKQPKQPELMISLAELSVFAQAPSADEAVSSQAASSAEAVAPAHVDAQALAQGSIHLQPALVAGVPAGLKTIYYVDPSQPYDDSSDDDDADDENDERDTAAMLKDVDSASSVAPLEEEMATDDIVGMFNDQAPAPTQVPAQTHATDNGAAVAACNEIPRAIELPCTYEDDGTPCVAAVPISAEEQEAIEREAREHSMPAATGTGLRLANGRAVTLSDGQVVWVVDAGPHSVVADVTAESRDGMSDASTCMATPQSAARSVRSTRSEHSDGSSASGKLRWTHEEDELLQTLVKDTTERVQWIDFVDFFPGRNTAMLRNRYLRISRKLPCTYKDGNGRKNLCRACGQFARGHSCPKRGADGASPPLSKAKRARLVAERTEALRSHAEAPSNGVTQVPDALFPGLETVSYDAPLSANGPAPRKRDAGAVVAQPLELPTPPIPMPPLPLLIGMAVQFP